MMDSGTGFGTDDVVAEVDVGVVGEVRGLADARLDRDVAIGLAAGMRLNERPTLTDRSAQGARPT